MKKTIGFAVAAALLLAGCSQPVRQQQQPQVVYVQQDEDCDADDWAEGDDDCFQQDSSSGITGAVIGGVVGHHLGKKHKARKSAYKPSRSSSWGRSSRSSRSSRSFGGRRR